jgi:large subunit ribosomal protein L23
MDNRDVILQFMATEKSTLVKEREGKYTFRIRDDASKHQVKQAVESLFNVHVDSVRTIVMPGKLKRLGRFAGKTPTWKKAVVKLKKDEKIDQFENL